MAVVDENGKSPTMKTPDSVIVVTVDKQRSTASLKGDEPIIEEMGGKEGLRVQARRRKPKAKKWTERGFPGIPAPLWATG